MNSDVPRRRRVLGRTAVVLFLVLGTVVLGAGPASAHPTLLFTDPVADTAVAATPPVITLVFNESVTAGPHALTLLDDAGRDLPVGATRTERDGQVISAKPAHALPPGTYLVRWQATGSDGDQVEEEFRFAVGTAVTAAGTDGGPPIAWGDAALRWVLFAGLAAALGGLIGERFTASARAENRTLRPVRSQVVPGALAGLAGATGLATLLITGTGTASSLWQGRAGPLLVAEFVGLACAPVLAGIRSGRWRAWSAVPLAAAVIAEGLRSHANQAAPGWGAALTGVHLAAVAIWAGALAHVVRAVVAWRRERPAVQWVLSGYVRLAGWVFAVVVATGTVSALLLVPLPSLVSTTYGQVLLIKLGLVAVAAGLAVAARRAWRHRDRLDRARAVARVEAGVLVGVLAVSAVLVSAPPAGSRQPAPPSLPGPVVPLGTLAGQIGVSIAAGEGRLVVRLTTPRRGDYYAPQAAPDYTLSGQLAADRADGTPLELRGCGDGCFESTVDWKGGDNVLTLRAEAPGWRGGTVSLLVPWPARGGADDLARAVHALRSVQHLTVYETVTSDTTTGPPEPQRLDLTGAFFLAQEPYASGIASVATRISRDGTPIRLALGYPAASTNVALTLDSSGRINEETLTDDSHLIHRRFVYPGHD
jgi:copper transport protein